MASGNTLCKFFPANNEPPAANYAQLDTVNTTSPVSVLAFDTSVTPEYGIFTDIMPQNYSAATGITVYVEWAAASATSGTIGWTVELERWLAGTDNITAESWGPVATITAATVAGTAGIPSITSIAITAGANMDGVVAGDTFRTRLKRDAANDTAAGDAHFVSMEIRET